MGTGTTHLVEDGEGGDDEDGVDAVHDQLEGEEQPERLVGVPEHGRVPAQVINDFNIIAHYLAPYFIVFR